MLVQGATVPTPNVLPTILVSM